MCAGTSPTCGRRSPDSGEAAASAAVLETLTPYRLDDDGFKVQNLFRYAIGTRP
jgi:hypothetical protein